MPTHPFPDRLRQLRARSTLSQTELAERSGLSLSCIKSLEAGRRPDPSLSTLVALAKGLRLTLAELVGG